LLQAMLISPWIPAGAVFQEPQAGPSPTSQFEHASVPATIRQLFGLPDFLTERDAWAGTFAELLTLDAPRTDAPMHLPSAPNQPPPSRPGKLCGNRTGDLPCAPFLHNNLCVDAGALIGSGSALRGVEKCFGWCKADAACRFFSVTQAPLSAPWCIRYTACVPRNSSEAGYETYEMGRDSDGAPRRQLSDAEPTTGHHSGSAARHHCGREESRCNAADGRPSSKQRNQIPILAHLTGSEKDAKLAQKLGQLQPFISAFPQECVGQLASFGPT
jgi:hypothetical protein